MAIATPGTIITNSFFFLRKQFISKYELIRELPNRLNIEKRFLKRSQRRMGRQGNGCAISGADPQCLSIAQTGCKSVHFCSQFSISFMVVIIQTTRSLLLFSFVVHKQISKCYYLLLIVNRSKKVDVMFNTVRQCHQHCDRIHYLSIFNHSSNWIFKPRTLCS